MITIYVDVLFLINFALDYIVLVLCGKLFHYPLRKARLIFVSICMAIYAVWALLFCGSYFILIVTGVGVLFIACALVYSIKRLKALIKLSFVYSGISALLGAIIYLLYGFIQRVFPPVVEGNGGGKKVLAFTILAGISGICLYFGNRILVDVRGKREVEVTIHIDKKNAVLRLLVDSGNLVSDPVSGRKVIIMSLRSAKKIFGNNLYKIDYLSTRRRWICVHTSNGVKSLQGFLPEKIVENNRILDALIAISEEEDFDGYEGLFPASLL